MQINEILLKKFMISQIKKRDYLKLENKQLSLITI